jgi:hypothetical protein
MNFLVCQRLSAFLRSARRAVAPDGRELRGISTARPVPPKSDRPQPFLPKGLGPADYL